MGLNLVVSTDSMYYAAGYMLRVVLKARNVVDVPLFRSKKNPNSSSW